MHACMCIRVRKLHCMMVRCTQKEHMTFNVKVLRYHGKRRQRLS